MTHPTATQSYDQRLAAAAAEIEAAIAEIPNAKPPTAAQLVSLQSRGLDWDYETGQGCETKWACLEYEPVPVEKPEYVPHKDQHVPVIGILSRHGIGVYVVPVDHPANQKK